jgi:DNA-binding transcriptional regulator YdaS (Cro superfamily)
MPTVRAQAVRRACEIVGGVAILATQFGVSAEDLNSWGKGIKPVPQEVFLRVVDIIAAHELDEISNADPYIKIRPPTKPDDTPH